MTTTKFEATPTPNENVKDAWKNYEAKPEFKEFNKHDLIESMQNPKQEKTDC